MANAFALKINDQTHDRGVSFVRLWLWVLVALVFAMVVVGGATRLTGSGLSITEWSPIMGAIPPLSDSAWLEAFEKYKAIPQYRLVNEGMVLDEFKFIFWWEWSHRQLGRAIGVVFALGFLWGFYTGALRGRLALKILGVGALGGLQAMIGWIMVASGLKGDMTAVAPVKLMLHLTTASVIYTLLVMQATSLGSSLGEKAPIHVKRIATVVLLVTLLQIALGALVAGSKAGLTWNTWPLIDSHFVPPKEMLFSVSPWIENFVDNTALVQFNHRMSAYLLLAVALYHGWQIARAMPQTRARRRAVSNVWLVSLQAVIGIATLLYAVPLWLGLLHQAFAFVVLGMVATHRAALSRG
ncbi:MAG: COX15/CtaA family protein [Hyphomicrobiales bacterium]